MKSRLHTTWMILLTGVLAAATSPFAAAQDEPAAPAPAATGPQIETIVVGSVKVGEALAEANATERRTNQMRRVAAAMDTQLRAALGATRKFRIVVGTDLDEIMAKHKRGASGLYNANDPNAARVGELRPPKYVVIPTIDDFQDVGEVLQSGGRDPIVSARRVRVSMVASIQDINSGEEKETVNIQMSERIAGLEKSGLTTTGDDKDAVLLGLTRRVCEAVADRVVDVIFPAKIVARTDETVTINRGDGTSIAVGQLWDVFALGEELKDPDTGESLGREEVAIGRVRVTSVQPKFSKARVMDNDLGIDKGQVLRLHAEDEAGKTAEAPAPE